MFYSTLSLWFLFCLSVYFWRKSYCNKQVILIKMQGRARQKFSFCLTSKQQLLFSIGIAILSPQYLHKIMNFHKCLSFQRTNTMRQEREILESQLILWCPQFSFYVFTEGIYTLLWKCPWNKLQTPTTLEYLLFSSANENKFALHILTFIFKNSNSSYYNNHITK